VKGGLEKIPSQRSLATAYETLLHTGRSRPDLKKLACFTQWARFDPRLAEILATYFSQQWKSIHPLEFRAACLACPWPGSVGVLLEFSRRAIANQGSTEAAQLFNSWRTLVTHGMDKAQGEQYFIGLRQLGGSAMWEDALFASNEYREWGYLARENLLPKEKGPSLSPATRLEILDALLSSTSRIRTQDYWNAIGRGISIRQAERDLLKNPHLRSSGETKGRYFTRKNSRK
jgi:hypothetical protein